jgi:ER membrane protein complex subunit 4
MSVKIPPPPPPQWVLDLNSTPPSKSKSNFPDPPGFTLPTTTQPSKKSKNAVTPRKQPSGEEMDTLKLKKAWEMAIAPAKQLPMNAIGMYMTGNSLQIFSIMMVFMLFKAPVQAILNIQNTFSRLETEGNRANMVVAKLAFVGCNLLALALGIWKVNGMGLLPYVHMHAFFEDSANGLTVPRGQIGSRGKPPESL